MKRNETKGGETLSIFQWWDLFFLRGALILTWNGLWRPARFVDIFSRLRCKPSCTIVPGSHVKDSLYLNEALLKTIGFSSWSCQNNIMKDPMVDIWLIKPICWTILKPVISLDKSDPFGVLPDLCTTRSAGTWLTCVAPVVSLDFVADWRTGSWFLPGGW